MSKREHGRSTDVSTAKHYLEDTQTERLSVLEPIWSRLRSETATLTGGLVVHPGVSIDGNSVIGQGVHLGRGAVVQGAVVGRGATVLPGSVVLSAVPPGAVVGGIPAQPIEAG